MQTKLKQKFNHLIRSGIILIATVSIFASFLPVFVTQVKAQPVTPQGPAAECTIASGDATSQIIKVNKHTINKDEAFEIYSEFEIKKDVYDKCVANGKDSYYFSYYVYKWIGSCGNRNYNYRVSSNATLFSEKKADGSMRYGFRHRVTNASLLKFFEGTMRFTGANYGDSNCFYSYFHKRGEEPENGPFYITYEGGPNAADGYIRYENKTHPVTDDTIPQSPGADSFTTVWEELPVNNNKEGAKADEIGVILKPDEKGAGLRNKYRVSLEDTNPMEFGKTKMLDAIYADWLDGSPKLAFNQYIGIPSDNKATQRYDYSPQFKYVKLYFADGSKPWSKTSQCEKDDSLGTAQDDRCNKIVYEDGSFGTGSTGDASPVFGNKGLVPGTFNPVLKSQVWVKPEFQKTVAEGESVGSVQLYAIPILWAKGTAMTSYVLGKGNIQKITLEVYKTDKDIIAACKKDEKVTDKTKCDDINFAKFGFGESVTQSNSSSETADGGALQTLYGFITRVISDIIIWLQSVIYRVFAYVVVPILNALLHVRPYQDKFVNIIYPGWLILRNLANIFFIVSLLVVGLRILFQQSAAGAARSFIMRLVIMALLVNFSLVIAQGIIGIADTVQSQFLPANTKIIEALGHKLMVEPLKNFRDEVTEADKGVFNSANSEAALSDTVKPLVLLILSIAAFFSFVAVAAFLTVRLVALWVLYMLSPIAYVGFVMDETKKYASQWWSEFIKYAIITPVLVFFLNIAALMATVFSNGGDKGLFDFNNDDSLSGDVVIGSLTILTHFIVLFFLFAGMKFAQSSGTFGSTAIVDYAKKGFDTFTKRPAKWVGNAAKGAAQNQYERKIKGGLFDPMAYKQAWKDSTDRKNKDKMSKRLAKTEGRLTPTALIDNKWRSLKYMATGGRWGGRSLLSNKAALEEEAGIMNDTARTESEADLATTLGNAAKSEREAILLKSGQMSFESAQKLVDKLEAKAREHEAKKQKLDDDATEAGLNGRGEDAKRLTKEATEQDRLMKKADIAKRFLEAQATKDKRLGSDGVAIDSAMKARIGVEYDFKKAEKDLDEEVKTLQDKSDKLLELHKKDDELKDKYGYGSGGKTMDDKRRKAINDKIESYTEKINGREVPLSMAQREARLARQREHDKSIEELDDDELEQHFHSALADNNLDLAIAISKKIAKEGNFGDLLQNSKDKKGENYMNNVEGFQKFMGDKFGKMAPTVRMQVGSEISSIAQKNGNYAISKATKVLGDKSIAWQSSVKHNEKIDNILKGKKPEDMIKSKKDEITKQIGKTSTGKKTYALYKGAVENFTSMNEAKANKIKEQMSSKLAKHIMDSTNFHEIKNDKVQAAIRSAATGVDEETPKP